MTNFLSFSCTFPPDHLFFVESKIHHFTIIAFICCRGHDPKDFFQVWKENCLIGDDLNFDKENIVQLLSIKNKDINRSYATQQDKDKKTIIPSKNVTGDSKSIPLPPSFASRNPVLVLNCS